jgi:hypothetical protein
MNKLVATVGSIARRYGAWIILGLIVLEAGLAWQRGELD